MAINLAFLMRQHLMISFNRSD